MPTLIERIETDYKVALKAGERLRVDTIRLVKAGIQRMAIEKRKETLEDADVLQVLSEQAKQRRETMESAKQTNRQDVLTLSTQELAILSTYLPPPLAQEAIQKLIEEAVGAVGLNQGQIMKYVMGKATGAADGKAVSQLVSARLKKG